MLVMAAEPARALATSVKERARVNADAHPADPVVVLARGSGYAGGTDAALVRSLQRRLDRSGFTPGPIDGRFGPRTEQAVELFQRAHGLVVDGIAGPADAVGPAHAGRPCCCRERVTQAPGRAAVRRLQRQLRRDGFSPGPIDGRYGPLTERAVSRFQAAHGLQVDGIAGRQTFGELAASRPARAAESSTAVQPAASTPEDTIASDDAPAPRAEVAPGDVAPGHTARRSTPRGRYYACRPDEPARERDEPVRRPSRPEALVLAGLIGLAAFISGAWLVDRRRRTSNRRGGTIGRRDGAGRSRRSQGATEPARPAAQSTGVELRQPSHGRAHGPVEAGELVDRGLVRCRSATMPWPHPISACYSSAEATWRAPRRRIAGGCAWQCRRCFQPRWVAVRAWRGGGGDGRLPPR